ncbi:tetratricopeptide repeat protein [Burkholderiaceae bacterium FT117]|uniref:YfgM family protein n=1 Tax=Zeimonas sediminis TaxID=2944268 RepID=UPI002342FDB6|nr:tetratricopeptide repeat protein [Zeimonas sediminis]MCM5571932.1 tetratricopeptide repeat protein [Zeimonas sediminis]
MAYDLEEQEQLENLKAFWHKYGNFILTVVLVVALSWAGWRGWQWYQTNQSAQASQAYDQLREAAGAKDVGKVREAAGRIFADYGGTAWAQMAALVAADAYVEAGDAKAAKVPLQWAVENARDPAFRDQARLGLAAILLDEKAYDEALKLLAAPAEKSYAAAFADRRGDLLVAQGKPAEARAAYQEALGLLGNDSALRRLVQIKLDAIGGGSA